MEKFKKLGINENVLKAIADIGFKEPSEIQEKAIPSILEGKDLIGGSATGSGKTLVFGVGIIQNVQKYGGIQALILTPTRELAEQISKALEKFSKYSQFKISTVYGGVSITKQIRELRESEIVVGTPGRILDHFQRNTINFEHLKFLVLDEADRMLDMGFIDDVDRIITQCPKKRQTLLFSATITPEVSELAKRYTHDAKEIAVHSYVDSTKLTQMYYDVESKAKFSLLVYLLKKEKTGLVMIFCNTRRNTDFVARNLELNGIEAMAIHGGLSQDRRTKIIEHFHAQNVYVLVCTDVAARGLDIKGVSHIYNYDIPVNSKEYIHRVGRTARAGKEGIAISLVCERDYENFNNVLQDKSLDIFVKETPEIPRANIQVFERSERGRNDFRGGSRGGMRGNSGGNSQSRSRSSGRFGSSRSSQHSGRSFSSDSRKNESRGTGTNSRYHKSDNNSNSGYSSNFSKPRPFNRPNHSRSKRY